MISKKAIKNLIDSMDDEINIIEEVIKKEEKELNSNKIYIEHLKGKISGMFLIRIRLRTLINF